MTLSNILSGISILLAASLVIWMKVISARAFKSIDDKIKDLHERGVGLDSSVRKVEKDIIRLNESEKSVEKDIKHVKADLVREAQVMNNQLETVHKKIDHIDDKLDKLRDNRR
jgi:predicted  nucleic acid-binding Zn-ribbon protein